jgi:hypothetical protein
MKGQSSFCAGTGNRISAVSADWQNIPPDLNRLAPENFSVKEGDWQNWPLNFPDPISCRFLLTSGWRQVLVIELTVVTFATLEQNETEFKIQSTILIILYFPEKP